MKKTQQGMGLMEVIVALLILAIAILGFAALQLRAVQASVEAGNNIHATNIARDLTERMRLNREGIKFYYTKSIPTATTIPCETNCTAEQQVENDLYLTNKTALDAGMSFAIDYCPDSTFKRVCVFVAWGETYIDKGNLSSCVATKKVGTRDVTSYVANSQCIMMETYNDQ